LRQFPRAMGPHRSAAVLVRIDQRRQRRWAFDRGIELNAKLARFRHGDELPAELARRDSRLVMIRAAKAALEQEARERAAIQAEAGRAKRDAREQRVGSTRGKLPKIPDPEHATPAPTASTTPTASDPRPLGKGSG